MGSIAPDFEYFIRMQKMPSEYSHTLPGLFLFNLPVALALAFMYHLLVKKPLLHNLPGWLSGRFWRTLDLNWLSYFRDRWPVVIVSVLLGAASHLLWDWFTHYVHDTNITNPEPIYYLTLFDQKFEIYIYTIFHFLNSLVGLMVLLYLFLQLPVNRVSRREYQSGFFWIAVLMICFSIFLLRMYFRPFYTIDEFVTILIAALLLALFAVSLIWRVKRHFNLKCFA
ncbi:hypothetical protein D770_03835 [Flammeovirgaceae bacterium 311]|nr:hypothetical protein D770_03835 [Flammeovirgaceae bacterium 311]